MHLTQHAEERIRQRKLPRQSVLQSFEQGMVMLSWNGARIAAWGKIRAVAKGETIITAYWRRRRNGQRRKGKGRGKR